MLTFEQVKELVELVSSRGLRRLEIERSGFRLKIDGEQRTPAAVTHSAPPAPVSAVEAPAITASTQVLTAEPETPEGPPDGAHVLTSPIVGTFYAAPNPEAEPYVKTGDAVSMGQVLCIVEAMKLMNEIESDADGVVLEIYPKNGQPVEFGEPLFVIDPR